MWIRKKIWSPGANCLVYRVSTIFIIFLLIIIFTLVRANSVFWFICEENWVATNEYCYLFHGMFFFFFFPEITVTGIFLSVLFYFVNNFVSFFWYFTISHLFITCQLIWGFERNILLFPVINIRCHYIEEESLYSLRTHSSVTSGRSVTLLCI